MLPLLGSVSGLAVTEMMQLVTNAFGDDLRKVELFCGALQVAAGGAGALWLTLARRCKAGTTAAGHVPEVQRPGRGQPLLGERTA